MSNSQGSNQKRDDFCSTVNLLWSTALASSPNPRQSLQIDQAATVSHQHQLVVRSKSVRPVAATETKTADYELRGLLGEGGMGLVYDARQAAVDRSVAVKMLKPDINANDQMREKFLHEAVITGTLDHPNIVPIYELGSTEEGVLFYAMKQLGGIQWTDLIESHSEEENLDILLRVCDAMSFAHSRQIVHCDLKPANVKLGDFGEVYVLDWGLAIPYTKVQGTKTMSGTLVGGTPVYMPPEIASGVLDRIGPASDIYLLGAILYEVLTGHPPHSGKTASDCLVAAAMNEIVATEQTGELIEIALKAMSGEPENRFHSVKQFQESIKDYLKHRESNVVVQHAKKTLSHAVSEDEYESFSQAVSGFRQALSLWDQNTLARAGLEEAQVKFAQSAHRRGDFDLALSQLQVNDTRHAEMVQTIQRERNQRETQRRRLRTIRITATSIVLLLVLLLSGALLWVTNAERRVVRQHELVLQQYELAVQQFNRAEQNFSQARKAVDQMLSEVGQHELANTPHMEQVRKRLLERALNYYQEFLTDRPGDVRVRAETARAYQRVAQISGMLGHVEEQRKAYRKSIELYQQLAKNDPQDIDFQEQMAVDFNELGESYRMTGETDKAEKAYGQAVEIQRKLTAKDSSTASRQQELARTTYNLALLYFETDRAEQANRLYQQSIDLLEPLVQKEPEQSQFLQQLARVLLNRGNLAKRTNQTAAAEADYRRAIDLLSQILQQTPQHREVQYEQAILYGNLGNLLQQMPDRRAESLVVYQNTVANFEQLVNDFPQLPQYRRGWANTLNSVAALHFLEKKTALAQQGWRESLEIYRPLVVLHSDRPDYQSEFGSALANLGYLLIDEDKTASQQMLQEAINHQQHALNVNPQHPGYRTALANHLRSLVIGYAKWNQHLESLETAKKLLHLAPPSWQPSYYTARQVLRSVGQLQEDASLPVEKREQLQTEGRRTALGLLQAAVREGFSDLQTLQTDPLFESLRKQSEFVQLMADLKTSQNQD